MSPRRRVTKPRQAMSARELDRFEKRLHGLMRQAFRLYKALDVLHTAAMLTERR